MTEYRLLMYKYRLQFLLYLFTSFIEKYFNAETILIKLVETITVKIIFGLCAYKLFPRYTNHDIKHARKVTRAVFLEKWKNTVGE